MNINKLKWIILKYDEFIRFWKYGKIKSRESKFSKKNKMIIDYT